MNFPSAGTPDFWRCYHALPAPVRAAARKAFQLWRQDAFHPSLHFKKIGREKWSVRVGIHYRAVGKFAGDTMVLGMERIAWGVRSLRGLRSLNSF